MPGEPPGECTAAAERTCAEAGALGSCALGKQTCLASGTWGACSVSPHADSCAQGNDDSCNGVPNEGCACVDGKSSICANAKGNCAEGTQMCTGGVLSNCSIIAKPQDSCVPGDDGNCNGIPNEGCSCKNAETQPCGPTKAVGICKLGLSTCSAGAFGTCVGAVYKTNRDCRSKDDNDCDGIADNTVDTVCACVPGAQQACGGHAGAVDGKGICKAGTQTCASSSDNSTSFWGSCSGAVGPSARNCASSLDNDCNGVIDNQESACACTPGSKQACQTHAQDGKGICKAGSQTCSASSDGTSSSWGTCTGSVGPAARDCTSSTDNNCDGSPDNTIDGVCQCTSSSCSGTVCKLAASGSQCVACLSSSDCSNGGTCTANACQCKANFNGNRCQFQTFRGIGIPLGDNESYVYNISPDGAVVVGESRPADQTSRHPWRFVNGTLNVIPRPAGKTFCSAHAVDSSSAIYGSCESSSFQYVNGTTSALSFGSYTAYAADVSRDGKVTVGYADFDGQQAIVKVGSTTTLILKLGTDFSAAYATNADGSIVVGDEYVAGHVGWFWKANSGTVKLPQQPDFGNYDPTDISADGTVIVGYEYGGVGFERAIKWSGSNFSVIDVKPGHYNSTSRDGKVSVGWTGDSPTVATVWDATGAHAISSFVDAASLSGWTLTSAMAVSDDGKWVAGHGTYNGADQPWLAHLP